MKKDSRVELRISRADKERWEEAARENDFSSLSKFIEWTMESVHFSKEEVQPLFPQSKVVDVTLDKTDFRPDFKR